MKLRLLTITIICFILALACSEDTLLAESYTVCTTGEIININDRMNNQTLEVIDWPLPLRAYVNANFAGYFIESISKYGLLDAEYYIVEMNNGGYVLFDTNGIFRCADDTFNGGPRIFIGILDTTTTAIDTSVVDTMVVPMDTLIVLIEEALCDPDRISFERQILPIIGSSCAYVACHDNESQADGIVLQDFDGIRGEVSPFNVNNSEIIRSFRANVNSDRYMPPLPALAVTDQQVQMVEDWISQGATNTTCNIPCNSLETSWSQNIYPLLQNSCIGCHQTTNDLGGVNLESYEQIQFYVLSGSLLGSIKHTQGYDAMPEVALKLTDCQIAMVENWITEGALNN